MWVRDAMAVAYQYRLEKGLQAAHQTDKYFSEKRTEKIDA